MTPGKSYADFMVMLRQPGLLMCDIADEASFRDSALVTLTPLSGVGATVTHQVVSYPERSDVGGAAADADHGEILLRRLQFDVYIPATGATLGSSQA